MHQCRALQQQAAGGSGMWSGALGRLDSGGLSIQALQCRGVVALLKNHITGNPGTGRQ